MARDAKNSLVQGNLTLLYITVGHGPRRQEDARRRSDYFRTGQEHGWNSRGSAYVYVCVCVCVCVCMERKNYISVEREKEIIIKSR